MFKLDLEKAEKPEIKLPTFTGSCKKAGKFQKNIYFWFIDYAKASMPRLKPSFTQEPTSFRARNTRLTLQQCKNITLSIKTQEAKSHTKPKDTSKPTIGHFIALQREEIQLHSPEHLLKLP